MAEQEQPPQTQPTNVKRLLVILVVAVALAGGGALVLPHLIDKPAAQIYSSGYGLPAAAELALTPGAKLDFQLFAEHADFPSRSQDKRVSLLLRIELRKGKEVTLVKECIGIGGSQTDPRTLTETTFFGDDCDLTVPEPGADLIEITPRWKHGGEGVKVTGLVFRVFVDDA
jgi:hypothetical protein